MLYSSTVLFIGGVVNSLTLRMASSALTHHPPTFTLVGQTKGGPAQGTWTRDGTRLSQSLFFSIHDAFDRTNNDYTQVIPLKFTLIVRGTFPGVYGLSVSNRDSRSSMARNITIEGTAVSFSEF